MNMNDYMSNAIKSLNTKVEASILSQLNELISRNLLEIRMTQPTLVREADSTSVKIAQQVQLVLKDQEYIEELERKNIELQSKIDHYNLVFSIAKKEVTDE